jgi:hypothetical protein
MLQSEVADDPAEHRQTQRGTAMTAPMQRAVDAAAEALAGEFCAMDDNDCRADMTRLARIAVTAAWPHLRGDADWRAIADELADALKLNECAYDGFYCREMSEPCVKCKALVRYDEATQ